MEEKWLLNEDEYWNEDYQWMAELFFAENGITCESDTYWDFFYSRWDDEDRIICPFCESKGWHYHFEKLKRWKCKKCRKQFSMTSKTYIDNTKIPLTHWWRLAYLLGSGAAISSYFVVRDLGLTQKSSWFMLRTVGIALNAKNFRTPFRVHHSYKQHKIIEKLMNLNLN